MNITKHLQILSVLLLLGASVCGQSLSYLGISPDARAASMGEIGLSTSPDAWSLYWNGAKSVQAENRAAIAYGFMPRTNDLMKESRLHAVGAYYKLNDKNAILAGFRYSTSGEFDVGTFSCKPYDFTIEAGYSRSLIQNLSAGITARYLYSNLDVGENEDAHGVAFDVSLFYRKEVTLGKQNAVWNSGVAFTDFGPQISYGDSKYALPSTLQLGSSLTLPFHAKHIVTCALEGSYRLAPSEMKEYFLALGAEYNLFSHFELRAGYHFGDVKHGGGDYLSLGGGVNYRFVQVQAAWQTLSRGSEALNNLLRISIGFNWNCLCK